MGLCYGGYALTELGTHQTWHFRDAHGSYRAPLGLFGFVGSLVRVGPHILMLRGGAPDSTFYSPPSKYMDV